MHLTDIKTMWTGVRSKDFVHNLTYILFIKWEETNLTNLTLGLFDTFPCPLWEAGLIFSLVQIFWGFHTEEIIYKTFVLSKVQFVLFGLWRAHIYVCCFTCCFCIDYIAALQCMGRNPSEKTINWYWQQCGGADKYFNYHILCWLVMTPCFCTSGINIFELMHGNIHCSTTWVVCIQHCSNYFDRNDFHTTFAWLVITHFWNGSTPVLQFTHVHSLQNVLLPYQKYPVANYIHVPVTI